MGLAFVIFGLYIGQEHKLTTFTKRLYLSAYFALIVPVTVIVIRYIVNAMLSGELDDPILSVAFLLLIPITVFIHTNDSKKQTCYFTPVLICYEFIYITYDCFELFNRLSKNLHLI